DLRGCSPAARLRIPRADADRIVRSPSPTRWGSAIILLTSSSSRPDGLKAISLTRRVPTSSARVSDCLVSGKRTNTVGKRTNTVGKRTNIGFHGHRFSRVIATIGALVLCGYGSWHRRRVTLRG